MCGNTACGNKTPNIEFRLAPPQKFLHMPTQKQPSGVARTPSQNNTNAKVESLETFRSDATDQALTTNHGVKISDNQNSLRQGECGPLLLEDFIMREKITHFDHERIPERIVHARGAAAHGMFKVYESQAELTKAAFLQDPSKETPVYVRFSTVQGSRGSADTVRDMRGFAVKFYTEEGNFDLVGNNMPVFFIQDAIKFSDFVHAVKPEPPNTFWDFVSLVPELAHIVLWTMSDRTIPKSFRTMEGFGIHTFRFINEQGKGRFVKFHWRAADDRFRVVAVGRSAEARGQGRGLSSPRSVGSYRQRRLSGIGTGHEDRRGRR